MMPSAGAVSLKGVHKRARRFMRKLAWEGRGLSQPRGVSKGFMAASRTLRSLAKTARWRFSLGRLWRTSSMTPAQEGPMSMTVSQGSLVWPGRSTKKKFRVLRKKDLPDPMPAKQISFQLACNE